MIKKTYKVKKPKPGSHKYNLIGEKFGLLTVKSYFGLNKNKNKVWVCKCDCGNICNVTTTYLNNGKTTSCKCNQYKKGKNVYNYCGYEDITGTKWNSIKKGAEVRGLEFKITKEYIWELLKKQNNKCYFSSVSISYKEGTASIDRIDNLLGYTENNVVIVHKDINLMRNKFSVDYFIKMCKLVTKNNN